MDFDSDTRVSMRKKGQFLFFWVLIFFFFKHVSTSHFFFICVYTTRNTSHFSAPDNTPWVPYLSHAQAAHARDPGQAGLHSGAAARSPASPLLSNGLPLPALSPLALLSSSSDSVPYEVVRCQDSPLLAQCPPLSREVRGKALPHTPQQLSGKEGPSAVPAGCP